MQHERPKQHLSPRVFRALSFSKTRLQRLLANLQFGNALFQGFARHVILSCRLSTEPF
ncbi:hypothetical protein ACK83U_19280 (plasmid) [Rhizobium sp. WW22]|uniref:choline/carnitine O-acyltransferase n=1 Tax=unclassified Rhizobium TaxID=2613769 RepID=UPI0013AFB8C9|nr:MULTISPECIES: choline/carnitine O-acyltransferase [unclassified Rhizobium]MBB3386674.1 hypothetical protein [Rhizobium sp. BK098]MBB3618378.1 hypothetical protein [Rhizobium sp. BK609]MBB3684035.1 hypothetical protein [Rhizobium sp. BK612]